MPEFDMGYYILEGPEHELKHVTDTLEWGRWLETHRAERIVKIEHFGDYEINTVFIGLDMNQARILNPYAEPLLFETAVFGGFSRGDGMLHMERCGTWEQAEAMHKRVADRFRSAMTS